MALQNFVRFCEELPGLGWTVHKAEYSGDSFGGWSIEFSSEKARRHRLVWEGRDGWLILQSEQPVDQHKRHATMQQIRQMSYVDGVLAYSHLKAQEWRDTWIGRDRADQSLERALQELSPS